MDLKVFTWQVPNSDMRFPLGGPAPENRTLRVARKMDGPVVVVVVTDLPFLRDNGKPLIQVSFMAE